MEEAELDNLEGREEHRPHNLHLELDKVVLLLPHSPRVASGMEGSACLGPFPITKSSIYGDEIVFNPGKQYCNSKAFFFSIKICFVRLVS